MPSGKKPKAPMPAGTDWGRVTREATADAPIAHDEGDGGEPYNPNDAEAVAGYWASAVKRGPGRPRTGIVRPTLNMRVDADVLAAFKATGPGWQTRIHALLREAVAAGKVKP